ncbi:unnamed protein product [Rotaria magnacalcarata]|uniref:Uncharacterized protein n=1 Tax=Rotaria magnacalcarata TaxID=392030 RepID=A0A8S2LF81_9BILA|nr:unnamed protein product [Rotaria magnacalcarata]
MTTEILPIDSLMIDRWTNQWIKQLGFNNEQLLKRNTKVEQFSRLVLDRIKVKKSIDIAKREQLLLETLREYENRLSRTGFESDICEEFENMKLKQKELFIEKKHQELDLKEEKYIKELDQLSQNERSLCQILTATIMDIIADETLIKRIERLRGYLDELDKLKTERLTTIKSYRIRLNNLIDRLNFKLDNPSTISQLLDENYESCLTTDALGRIESLLIELECKSAEQDNYVNVLVGKLEKLYAKLARDDATPPKRSAAYILRHNTAETVKQVCFSSWISCCAMKKETSIEITT